MSFLYKKPQILPLSSSGYVSNHHLNKFIIMDKPTLDDVSGVYFYGGGGGLQSSIGMQFFWMSGFQRLWEIDYTTYSYSFVLINYYLALLPT